MHTGASSPTPRSSFGTGIIRWLSLRAYGLVMRSLFRPSTPPRTMRRRFERFGKTSRATVLARHPTVVFGDHRVGSWRSRASGRRRIPQRCCSICMAARS